MAASRMKLTLYLATAACLMVGLVGCGPNNPVPPQVQPDPTPIAGTGTFAGYVRESRTLIGIGGITVRLRQGTTEIATQVTQPNGRFFFVGLPQQALQADLVAPANSGFASRDNVATAQLNVNPLIDTSLIIFTIFDVPPGPG